MLTGSQGGSRGWRIELRREESAGGRRGERMKGKGRWEWRGW